MRASYGISCNLRSRSPARPPGLELKSGLWKIVLLFFQDLHSLSRIFSCLHFFFCICSTFPFLSLCFFSGCSFWTWPNVAILGLISMFSPLKYLHQLETSSLWLKTSKEKDLAGLPRIWLSLGQIILISWSHRTMRMGTLKCANMGTQPHSFQVMVE